MSKQTGAESNVKATYFRNVLERFSAHKLAVAGLIILFAEIILVLVLPPLLHLDPYTSDPIAFGASPSAEHVLGTDDVGRDLLARLVYGGRVSLMVGLLSTLISLCLGVPLGLIAGFLSQIAGGNHHAHCRHLYVVPRYDSGFWGISCCRRTVCLGLSHWSSG